MKPTADPVIKEIYQANEHFDALPPDEKRRVSATIAQRENNAHLVETDDFKSTINYTVLKHIDDLLEGRAASQKIYWKGILVIFVPNQYVPNYSEIWLLEAVLGSTIVRDRLREEPILDATFVELLFRQSPYSFYLNQAETYLFSGYDELSGAEGGPLKQLTAFDALQRYGLKLLEEAKEKQYVRL